MGVVRGLGLLCEAGPEFCGLASRILQEMRDSEIAVFGGWVWLEGAGFGGRCGFSEVSRAKEPVDLV